MVRQEIYRVSIRVMIGLSFAALLAVLSGYMWPPLPDEGAAAHIFQLAIVALAPTVLIFIATADWKQPLRVWRSLALSGGLLTAAFGSLYFLEHYR